MLHNKIVFKPEVASGMDQYIIQKVENMNIKEVNLDEAHRANF